MSVEALVAVSFLTPPATAALSLLDVKESATRTALYLMGLFVTMLLVEGLKQLFMVPRPTGMLVAETGYSFPSGHAALGFYPLGFYWLKSVRVRGALLLYGAVAAYARVGLGVHRTVDVLAGGLLAFSAGYLVMRQEDVFERCWTRLETAVLE